MFWIRRQPTSAEKRLAREAARLREQVAALETDVRKRDATIAVQCHEIESLCNVIVRNQMRVKAETADAAQQLANCKANEP